MSLFNIHTHEFELAVSFPGEHRAYVKAVVDALVCKHGLSPETIFYDDFFKAFLAVPSLDTVLQDLYRNRSKLIVVFLCKNYQKKQWCGLEARAIRDLIKERKNDTIMPIRMDDGEVEGFFGIDGWIDARKHEPAEIAGFIHQRLTRNLVFPDGISAIPYVPSSPIDAPPISFVSTKTTLKLKEAVLSRRTAKMPLVVFMSVLLLLLGIALVSWFFTGAEPGAAAECTEGACPFSPQPRLSHAQFSSDCGSVVLTGQPGIQPPARYASSTGSISTLCPGGLSGNSAGFSCPLNSSLASLFMPNEYSAQWTVKDDRGGGATSPPYAFRTTLENTASLFPLERLMPSAVLGSDAMLGRQVLTSKAIDYFRIGNPHPARGCWGGGTLRGSIAAGYAHTCALQPEGKVLCWGSNFAGETDVPEDLRPAVAVVAGPGHTCALDTGGAVRCWGGNSHRQTEVPKDLKPAVAIAAGSAHTCALEAGGRVRCWGWQWVRPAPPGNLSSVVAISADLSNGCALQADGAVRCWGGLKEWDAPKDLGAVVALASNGYYRTCALEAEGKVRCWGADDPSRMEVPRDLGFVVALAVGFTHTCALQADGTVRCWGDNQQGQTDVPKGLNTAVAIAAGYAHTCALQADGTVLCWGAKYANQGQTATRTGAAVQSIGRLVIHDAEPR